MANARSVWTILESAAGVGVPLIGRAAGDAIGGNHMPSMVAKDLAGLYQLLQLRASGQAVGSGLSVLGGIDAAGNAIYMPVKAEGDAIGNASPGLVAKDGAGNLKYLKVNGDGELVISTEGAGTYSTDNDSVVGVNNTATQVSELTLVASAVYETIEVITSCSFPTYWELIHSDNAVETVKASWMSSGSDSFEKVFQTLKVTAGATGAQILLIKGTQLHGGTTDMTAFLGALQKA